MKKQEPKMKEYKIKVPVFLTEKNKGNFSYESVISRIETELKHYNSSEQIPRIAFKRQNKTQQKVISSINSHKFILGDDDLKVPALFLQVTTYNTNLLDGYTEQDGTIKVFDNKTKLGSEKNFMIMFPNLNGYPPNYEANWLVFVYIDTNKMDSEMINTAKLVVNSVLHLNNIQITREDILSKIKKIKVPILKIRYTGVDINDEVDERFINFLVESKTRKDKSETFKNVPFELANQIIDAEYPIDEYQNREVKFIYGNSEYKLTKKLSESLPNEYNEFDVLVNEARNIFNEAAEHTFTDSFALFEDELSKMYNKDYIIDKISPIITNYIKTYDIK
ncbi:MAG: hypothetical protein WCR42_15995 [bacterium]